VEVCSSFNSNNRLKGIRIVGNWITDEGEIVYAPEAISKAERTNCSEWHTTVLCPTGTAGTGIIAHQNRIGSDDGVEIVGLQLICREVGVK